MIDLSTLSGEGASFSAEVVEAFGKKIESLRGDMLFGVEVESKTWEGSQAELFWLMAIGDLERAYYNVKMARLQATEREAAKIAVQVANEPTR